MLDSIYKARISNQHTCVKGIGAYKKSIPKLHSIKWKTGVFAPNVHVLENRSEKQIPVIDVLTGVINHGLDKIVIMGIDHDGEEYFASNFPDCREVNWLADRVKKRLLNFFD